MTSTDDDLRAAAEELINSAEGVLSSTSANRNRVACWIARSALEVIIDRLCLLAGVDVGQSTVRSRLVCLDVVATDDPGLSSTADYTWLRLSSACHHHAYQLDPSIVETLHLVDNVRQLCAAADRHGSRIVQ